ncbi:MAG: asparaginase [Actinomycetota bacterium]|nr:asparaginase [Actinomycetota bacterium]
MTPIDPASPHVVLLATGGTISSRASNGGGGATVASDTGEQVLAGLPGSLMYPVRVIDVFRKGSYLLTFEDMYSICVKIREVLNDPLVVGVVVTHGTDTMEETAFLADLTHNDSRPVVFTGAQRSADADDPDGPDNLAGAVAVASAPSAAGHGVLVCFAGEIYNACGLRKIHTSDLRAFGDPDLGPIGTFSQAEGVLLREARPRMAPLPLPDERGQVRVDLVAAYPGADETHLRASLTAGAKGVVLQATGIGNVNVPLVEVVAEATAAGVVVVTSTRVQAGPVKAVYGAGGGGRDLLAAGAIPSGLLRPSQSLILLALLLRLGWTRQDIAGQFASRGSAPQDVPVASINHLKGTS